MALHGVLRTRLLPPRPPPDGLPRVSLVRALLKGLQGRLVAVVAGAGYGKTTLLAQAQLTSDLPWAWCSCDARIGDVNLLVAHIVAGIGELFPGFGAQVALSGSADEVVDAVANEITETISDHFVIALDDVHLLPAVAQSALSPLVERLPANVHLVLSGRAPLPFPLARLRAARALELGEDQLALDHDETRDLVRSLGHDLAAEELAALLRQTEGWVAGVILASQYSGDAIHGTVTRAQFDFLAEEVYSRQTGAIQGFLVETSILGRFSPDLAVAVTRRQDAAEIVRRLVADHLFTSRLEDPGEWYRYHHLFQEFLHARLNEDEARARECHRRAAGFWEAVGEATEAVPHLLEAGDADDAIALLEPVAEAMALTPQADTLAGWLDKIPHDLWANRPRLILAQAALNLTKARHEESFADFERAIGELLDRGEHDAAAATLFRLQQAMLTAGTRPARRAAAGELHRDRIDPRAPLLPGARILLATAYGYGNRFLEAQGELDAALALPAAQHSTILTIYAEIARAFYVDFWTVGPHGALDTINTALDELEVRRDEDRLAFRVFARMLQLYLLLDLGRYEECLVGLERSMDEFRAVGIGRTVERAYRWVRSEALVGLGRFDAFAAEFVHPPRAADPSNATSYSYRYRAPAARLAAHRGDVEEVRSQLAAARVEMESFGVASDHPRFLAEFAVAAHAVGLTGSAIAHAREGLAQSSGLGSSWQRAHSEIIAALVFQGDEADVYLAQALELTAKASELTELWTRRERFIAPELLGRAVARGIGPPAAAERLLAACGSGAVANALAANGDGDPALRARLADVAGETKDMDIQVVDGLLRDKDPSVREAARRSWTRLKERPRAAIALVALGEFRVWRDGVPVAPSAFVRQKSRSLLAALVATGGPVHRETLYEWLWPELPPGRAAGALRSTLHDLRRAIEPELESGSLVSVITADGDLLRLSLGQGDSLDILDFTRMAKRNADDLTIDQLMTAERSYGGPFLREWPFEDWAMERRVELAELFKSTVHQLAEALGRAGRHQDAIMRYRRLLQMEPEREGWHRDLMLAYDRAGERALALRQYHACRARLRREQGIEPGVETRSLYETLLREQPL